MQTIRRIELPPYALWEVRAGSGSPVVLVHGLSGSVRWWRRNFDALAVKHTVAAVDLVGFGSNQAFSATTPLPPSFPEIAALLARWISSSFDEPVHLAGHSMGGQIAVHLAGSRPDLIRSLTLIASTGIPFTADPGSHLRNLARPPRGLWSFSRVLALDFLRAGPTSVAVASARLLLDDVRPLLPKLKMPVLLVWGRNDPLVPLRYGREMSSLIRSTDPPQIHSPVIEAKLEVIDGAGHVVMWDRPGEFNRILLEFLESVDQGPTPDTPRKPGFSWGIAGCAGGICHRQSGSAPRVVLSHGLGISSRYFSHLARSLFARGLVAAAPDMPGFGESENAPPRGPAEHAQWLADWCDGQGIRRAVFAGHSAGCQTVAHLALLRPELVAGCVFLSPMWNPYRFAALRLLLGVFRDSFREPRGVVIHAFRDYWRAGMGRIGGTLRAFLRDSERKPSLPPRSLVVIGSRDPLMNRSHLREIGFPDLKQTPGAHAAHYSHPEETAEWIATVVEGWMRGKGA